MEGPHPCILMRILSHFLRPFLHANLLVFVGRLVRIAFFWARVFLVLTTSEILKRDHRKSQLPVVFFSCLAALGKEFSTQGTSG